MPEGHDTIIEVSNIMSFVLYTQILKQSVLKPASPGITLITRVELYVNYIFVEISEKGGGGGWQKAYDERNFWKICFTARGHT